MDAKRLFWKIIKRADAKTNSSPELSVRMSLRDVKQRLIDSWSCWRWSSPVIVQLGRNGKWRNWWRKLACEMDDAGGGGRKERVMESEVEWTWWIQDHHFLVNLKLSISASFFIVFPPENVYFFLLIKIKIALLNWIMLKNI